MIEILHRHTNAVVYRSETATTVREAVAQAVAAGANLSGANLSNAYLSGADLGGATGIIPLGYPDGWCAYAWLRDGWLSVRGGCREFRLAEAREYWAGKADRREVLAAFDYAEAVAKLRGWPVT